MELLLALLIMLVFRGIANHFKEKERNQIWAAEATKSFKLEKNTLYVSSRNPQIADVLKIRVHKVKTYEYNPEKIHVGAVTVGGVTTGGVYKTGGNYLESSASDGRCKLVFIKWENGNSIEHEVKKIVLSDDLAKKARSSALVMYMTGATIDVVQEIKPSNAVSELMRAGLSTAAANQLSIEESKGYPNREKCETIIEWLRGE